MQLNILAPRWFFLLLLIGCGIAFMVALALKPRWTSRLHPNVAAEARRFLREKNVRPLSEDLQAILANSADESLPTQQHPLLGNLAPDFTLNDDRGDATNLQRCLEHGPVVLVFYYGYHCNHCVGQLFAVNDDLAMFQELDATIIAISADPVEETQARYAEYGRFGFTVLSDPGKQIAAQYGVFKPPVSNNPEELVHATFVITANGQITWCNFGDKPFTDNRTLLIEVARVSGREPVPEQSVSSNGVSIQEFNDE
ncbi:Putative peroxiredoxin bcp [Anatilimnocola aggregata]|uniref:thioredoxin-dependent peroxiredoxin n=1 Tax=Anatilimnocola aggregata TaxID=2528021 RepID=A0A517YJ76_9BACT|nr:redoxin domain-containing protein [Anatilimnocola aggregata]QDU30272.1 Putative peroxiredoxin bcp [Anatilimnocola aggregata]